MGLLIGSGAIESAQRNVVQKRMKQSGQRWTIKGAQQIVNLRVYHQSNKWEYVTEIIKKAA
ncbi:MAG: ISLre2 family transposase, partial [Dehalococcoidales bacterium]